MECLVIVVLFPITFVLSPLRLLLEKESFQEMSRARNTSKKIEIFDTAQQNVIL